MAALQRCIELLERNQVRYTHTRHANAYRAREVATAEHVPAGRLAKTIIFCRSDLYALAVIPADCLLDIDELGANLREEHLRLATEGEVAGLFPGCEVGAMPPIGPLFHLPVYLDERLAEEKHIVFSAGTHRDAIHMRMKDYILVAQPRIGRFAYHEAGVS